MQTDYIGHDRAKFLQTTHRILKPNGFLIINTMCNAILKNTEWLDTFDPLSRCIMHGDIATRYIGDSNHILQEIIQADFQILSAEISPPKHEDDLADLQVIAQKL